MSMRRFLPFVFLLCWSLALLWPASRVVLERDWRIGSSAVRWNAWPGVDESEVMIRQNPPDLDVQIQLARRGDFVQNARALERLVRAHPGEKALLALYLRLRVGSMRSNRNDGPLSNPNFPRAAPEQPNAEPRAEWEKLIRHARHGMQLDPNNTYFDWFALTGLLALRRDDEALGVLQRASAKTEFDEYLGEEIASQVRFYEKVNGVCDAGTRASLSWSVLFPHYAKLRQSARWMGENSFAASARGDRRASLQWSLHLMRLGRVMRTRSRWVIGSLVGSAIQGIAYFPSPLTLPKRVAFTAPKNGKVATLQAAPGSTAWLARSLGNLGVAREIENEYTTNTAWKQSLRRYFNTRTGDLSAQIPGSLLTPLVWSGRTRSLILHALPLLGLMLLVCEWLARRKGGVCPRRAEAWGALVALGVLGVLVAGDVLMSAIHSANDLGLTGASMWDWNVLWMGSAASVGMLKTLPMWAFGALGSALMCASLWLARRERERLEAGASRESLWKRMARGDELGLSRFDFSPLVALIGRWTLWAICISLVALIFATAPSHQGVLGSLEFLAFAASAFIIQLAAWRRTRRAGMFVDWATTLRRTLAGAGVALTLLYGALWWGTLPLQTRFDQKWNAYLQQGELQVARLKSPGF